MEHCSSSLKDLELHMPKILQVSRWKKAKVRQIFQSNNSFYTFVAHNPNARKVGSVTDAYNLHEETVDEKMKRKHLCKLHSWK